MKEHITPCICKTCLEAKNQALQSQTQDIEKKVEEVKYRYRGDGLIGRREDLYEEAVKDILKVINS